MALTQSWEPEPIPDNVPLPTFELEGPDRLLDHGAVNKEPPLAWVTERGAEHMWGDVEWFIDLEPMSKRIKLPSGKSVLAHGLGRVDLQVRKGTASRPAWTTIELDKVWYVPELAVHSQATVDEGGYTGIISLPSLRRAGLTASVGQKVLVEWKSGKSTGISICAPSGIRTCKL